MVTGGAGFIGSHLCERLLANGDDVLCVDNFFTGTKDNVAPLLSNPNFELLRHDVTFPALCRGRSRSTIWPARLRPSITNSIRFKRPRPASMAPSICWGWPSGCSAKILQASTSGGLWRPRGSSAARGHIGARSTLSASAPATTKAKRCAETLFFDYWRQHKLRIKVVAHLQHLRTAHASQ